MLRHLEAAGVPVLSAPEHLHVAVNRYRMTCELVRAGLPVPATTVTEDVDEAAAAVERFGSAVLKPLFTSKGRGMRRLEPSRDLRAQLESHRDDGLGPFYLQRFVKHPGRDLGVAVLDGRCIGAYWRIAADDHWMTTILSGGRYEQADLAPEDGGDRRPRRAPLRPRLHGRRPDRGLRRLLQRARGERVRRVPGAPERVRSRRGAHAGRRRAAALS